MSFACKKEKKNPEHKKFNATNNKIEKRPVPFFYYFLFRSLKNFFETEKFGPDIYSLIQTIITTALNIYKSEFIITGQELCRLS